MRVKLRSGKRLGRDDSGHLLRIQEQKEASPRAANGRIDAKLEVHPLEHVSSGAKTSNRVSLLRKPDHLRREATGICRSVLILTHGGARPRTHNPWKQAPLSFLPGPLPERQDVLRRQTLYSSLCPLICGFQAKVTHKGE